MMQAAFSAALMDPEADVPMGLVDPRGRADAKRFSCGNRAVLPCDRQKIFQVIPVKHPKGYALVLPPLANLRLPQTVFPD